jgi:opacity protein-like surface antigen
VPSRIYSLAVIGAALLWAIVAAAADVPRYEVFLGYTYVRANSAADIPAVTANGGGGQFSYNFNQWIGAVADLGAVHNGSIGGHSVDNTIASYLFGPRVSLRHRHLRPYFQLLWGGVYLTSSTQVSLLASTPKDPPVTARISAQQTAFSLAAGGGLDIRISKHVSIRPIALDYFMTRLQELRSQADHNQNNLRYTAGFNFTFGAR